MLCTGLTVEVRVCDAKELPYANGTFAVAVVADLLHHEPRNGAIFDELARVVTKRLIILETVPTGDSDEAIATDRERTYLLDWLYNRVFSPSDIPLPGTYETADGWETRLAEYGWKRTHRKEIAPDNSLIRGSNVLLVFEREEIGN